MHIYRARAVALRVCNSTHAVLSDITVLSQLNVLILRAARNFEFTVVVDTMSQEGLETFTLSLTVTTTTPQPLFVQDTLTVTIEDTTREFAAQPHSNHVHVAESIHNCTCLFSSYSLTHKLCELHRHINCIYMYTCTHISPVMHIHVRTCTVILL